MTTRGEAQARIGSYPAAQAVTAGLFVLLAAVAMFDSRRGALLGASKDPGGIGSGFYPFWAAALLGAAGVALLVRTLRSPGTTEQVFDSRDAAYAVLQLVVPMLVAAYAIAWLGIYLTTGLYMGFFARYIGRYRWVWVAAVAIGFPLALYLAFERGFRLLLPRSVLYGDLFPL